ncbi:hypothetical protein AWB72_05437 [Caballeronia concitans]|uniref:Uncharacterized protein n=2 Tax=Caballeronia concitans TaxID=1777133 RepID=A0A658R514_9BURK|nr:hypothetical protein AWB72_05437 [Caballeronia concitans]
MKDVGLLQLRKQLTVEEAACLLAVSGHDEGQWSTLLIEAIESGDLLAEPIVHWEVVDYQRGNYLGAINPMATIVQRVDLDAWCQQMGITLPSKTANTAGEAIAASAMTAVTPRPKERRGILDAPIDQAIEKAGRGASKAAVFLVLREMALAEVHPFSGTVTEKGLEYTDTQNRKGMLTRDALDARLRRRETGPTVAVDKRR